MKKYSQLTQEERYTLSSYLAKGYSISQIAKELGRHPSTLYREKKRNLRPSGRYAAFVAHSYATARVRRHEKLTPRRHEELTPRGETGNGTKQSRTLEAGELPHGPAIRS